MQTGTVKWFNQNKGYGFVASDTGEDLFVHFREIIDYEQNKPLEGDRVVFKAISAPRGPCHGMAPP